MCDACAVVSCTRFVFPSGACTAGLSVCDVGMSQPCAPDMRRTKEYVIFRHSPLKPWHRNIVLSVSAGVFYWVG